MVCIWNIIWLVYAYADHAQLAEKELLSAIHLAGERVEQIDGNALNEALLLRFGHTMQEYFNEAFVLEQLWQLNKLTISFGLFNLKDSGAVLPHRLACGIASASDSHSSASCRPLDASPCH